MNSTKPPRLAAWILQHFGPKLNHEALAGDLNEGFQQGRSKAWYWRQVLAAVRWRSLLYRLLILIAWSWVMTRADAQGNSPTVSRLLAMATFMAILMAVSLVFCFVLGMLRGKGVLRAVVIAIFLLLFRFDVIVGILLIWDFAFPRKAQGPYHLTLRELVFGDPDAERHRLIEKLHLAMLQETDPQVLQAYAEAIAALRTHEAPAAKATQ
ncbi:MAG TPA: hypothetical protein VGK21_13065 [Candidatus Angelobacter sp.]|jgi:hypothetical protein